MVLMSTAWPGRLPHFSTGRFRGQNRAELGMPPSDTNYQTYDLIVTGLLCEGVSCSLSLVEPKEAPLEGARLGGNGPGAPLLPLVLCGARRR
jgi:hypothetical protein